MKGKWLAVQDGFRCNQIPCCRTVRCSYWICTFEAFQTRYIKLRPCIIAMCCWALFSECCLITLFYTFGTLAAGGKKSYPKIRLAYFSVRAKAEQVRMTMAYAGIPWEEVTYQKLYNVSKW